MFLSWFFLLGHKAVKLWTSVIPSQPQASISSELSHWDDTFLLTPSGFQTRTVAGQSKARWPLLSHLSRWLYTVWFPYQEEREDVRFQGVVNQPLLHLHSFHGVRTCRWEEELYQIFSFPPQPPGPRSLGVEWFTFGGCSTLALHL